MTEYVPEVKFLIPFVSTPFDHLYSYGDMPPATVRSIYPSEPPKVLTCVGVKEITNGSVLESVVPFLHDKLQKTIIIVKNDMIIFFITTP